MPVLADFSMVKFEDGILTLELAPPIAIGGMLLNFNLFKRFGSSEYIAQRWVGSGLNNQSGINITSSGQGRMNISLWENDSSGLEFGNYAFNIKRLDSGSRTVLTEGYLVLEP